MSANLQCPDDLSTVSPSTDILPSASPAARRAKLLAILESQVEACDHVMGDVYTWLRSRPAQAGGSQALRGLVSLAKVCAQLAVVMERLEPHTGENAGSNPQENC